jgi:hypothetical protein
MSYARLNDWSMSVGRLVAAIDDPNVLRSLIDELAAAVAIDTWFMAVFYMDRPPFILDYLGMESGDYILAIQTNRPML